MTCQCQKCSWDRDEKAQSLLTKEGYKSSIKGHMVPPLEPSIEIINGHDKVRFNLNDLENLEFCIDVTEGHEPIDFSDLQKKVGTLWKWLEDSL